MKYYIAKLLRIPRRFRMIYHIYFNRFKFWLNDVKFGRNMQVYTKFFLNKAKERKKPHTGMVQGCVIFIPAGRALPATRRRRRRWACASRRGG